MKQRIIIRNWFVNLLLHVASAMVCWACSSGKPTIEIIAKSESAALLCPDPNTDTCCEPTSDSCRAKYGTVVAGPYIVQVAHSNGACTGDISGAHQCAMFAKGFQEKALHHLKCDTGETKCKLSPAWSDANNSWKNVALDNEERNRDDDNVDPVFVFRTKNNGWNDTSELPAETDVLVFENGGAGHFVVAMAPVVISDSQVNIPIIEENVASLSGGDYGPGGSCHHRVLVAKKNASTGRWEIKSGIGDSYKYTGFIRDNDSGVFEDTGFRTGSNDVSQLFRSKYLEFGMKLGWSFNDHGGKRFVHQYGNLLLQNFKNTNQHDRFGTDGETALILSPSINASGPQSVHLVAGGIFAAYKCVYGLDGQPMGGAEYLGAPQEDEHAASIFIANDGSSNCTEDAVNGKAVKAFQRFERGCAWYRDDVDNTVHIHLYDGSRIFQANLDIALLNCDIKVANNPPGPNCVDDCTPGTQTCNPENSSNLRVCGHPGPDSCYHWVGIACTSGFVCKNSDCVSTPSSGAGGSSSTGGASSIPVSTGGSISATPGACTYGTYQCDSTHPQVYQMCGIVDGTNVTTWISLQCGTNEVCSSGQCVPAPVGTGGMPSYTTPCTLGSRHCSTTDKTTYEFCTYETSQSDSFWITLSCDPGKSCDSATGQCVASISGTGGASSIAPVSTGGAPATGGSPSTGGAVSTGGTTSVGACTSGAGRICLCSNGQTSTDFCGVNNQWQGCVCTTSVATGGASATGGQSPTGGSPPTGGASPTGGMVSTGGVSPTGGTTSTIRSFRLHYVGPVGLTGPIGMGGWWWALDTIPGSDWRKTIESYCPDLNPNDNLFDCDLSMIPSGNWFKWNIYLPTNPPTYWGDRSYDVTGGQGQTIGTVTITMNGQPVLYNMVMDTDPLRNPNLKEYDWGSIDSVP